MENFNEDTLKNYVEHFLSSNNIEFEKIKFIRLGENGILDVIGTPYIFRFYRERKSITEINKEIQVSRWLFKQNFPTARISDDFPKQPFLENDFRFSIWDRVEVGIHANYDYSELGALLLKFHKTMHKFQINENIPKWNPIEKINMWFQHLVKYDLFRNNNDQVALEKRIKYVVDLEKEILLNDKQQLIHGDFYKGNTIINTNQKLILLDYENVCIGPIEWDCIATAISYERFGLSGVEYKLFTDGYGFDVMDSPNYFKFKLIRELFVILWLYQNIDNDDYTRREVDIRMKSIYDINDKSTWSAK